MTRLMPIFQVKVIGPSMRPTLENGQKCLAVKGHLFARPGAIAFLLTLIALSSLKSSVLSVRQMESGGLQVITSRKVLTQGILAKLNLHRLKEL